MVVGYYQSHSVLRKYWISRFFYQFGAVRKPHLPSLGKTETENGELNGSVATTAL